MTIVAKKKRLASGTVVPNPQSKGIKFFFERHAAKTSSSLKDHHLEVRQAVSTSGQVAVQRSCSDTEWLTDTKTVVPPETSSPQPTCLNTSVESGPVPPTPSPETRAASTRDSVGSSKVPLGDSWLRPCSSRGKVNGKEEACLADPAVQPESGPNSDLSAEGDYSVDGTGSGDLQESEGVGGFSRNDTVGVCTQNSENVEELGLSGQQEAPYVLATGASFEEPDLEAELPEQKPVGVQTKPIVYSSRKGRLHKHSRIKAREWRRFKDDDDMLLQQVVDSLSIDSQYSRPEDDHEGDVTGPAQSAEESRAPGEEPATEAVKEDDSAHMEAQIDTRVSTDRGNSAEVSESKGDIINNSPVGAQEEQNHRCFRTDETNQEKSKPWKPAVTPVDKSTLQAWADGDAHDGQGDVPSAEPDPEAAKRAEVNLIGTTAPTRDHGIVEQVIETEYMATARNGQQYSQTQKELLVKCKASGGVNKVRVLLRDDWMDVPVAEGSMVAVLGDRKFPTKHEGSPSPLEACGPAAAEQMTADAPELMVPEVVIDINRGMLILYPNTLVSGSRVSGSFACPRRAVLEERLRRTDVQAAALRGTMLHRLLQAALRMSKVSAATLKDAAKAIIALHSSDILSLGEDEEWAMRMLTEGIPSTVKWVNTFLRPQPGPECKVDFGSRDPPRAACVAEVLDIEESIWSPRLGLKGMVDVSVKARMPPKRTLGLPDTGPAGAQGKAQSWQDSLKGSSGRQVLAPLSEGSGNRSTRGRGQGSRSPASEALEDQVMALELKTGKKTEGQANVDHRAQLMLYSLLMSERYELPIRTGLLLYLHTGQTLGVEAGRRELVGLVIRRNCHAAALMDASSPDPMLRKLPPVLENSIVCGSCSMRDVCTAYAKAEQVGQSEYESSQQHRLPPRREDEPADTPMNAEHASFLHHWENLVDLEAAQTEASLHEVWSIPAAEREAKGRGIANLELVFDRTVSETEEDADKENSPKEEHPDPSLDNRTTDSKGGVLGELARHRKQRRVSSSGSNQARGLLQEPAVVEKQAEDEGALCHFRRRQGFQLQRCRLYSKAAQLQEQQTGASGDQEKGSRDGRGKGSWQDARGVGSFMDLPFAHGDYVVLSTEGGQVAVASGIIASITPDLITVRTAKPLRIPGGGTVSGSGTPPATRASRITWRIDRSESLGIMASMRMNLVSLFLPSAHSKGSEENNLRRLVVDLEAPREMAAPPRDGALQYLEGLSSQEVNQDQMGAIHKVLRSYEYTLIQGLPGCGKTSTIVHLVKALLARGDNTSVLLAAYTNTAVDNMLLKLIKEGVEVVRIGRQSAVHPTLQNRTYGDQPPRPMSLTQLKYNLAEARVVGVTCLGVSHPIFTLRHFDVCIVDEACQVTLPVCLGPLRFASSFVLVGDPEQLPPLVRSKKAREGGLSETLFRQLAQAHPGAVVSLATQYRMNEGIMALSNAVVYRGQLKCASETVRSARLELPWLNQQNKRSQPNRHSLGTLPAWLQEALDPKNAVVFLDTDLVPGSAEQKAGDAIFNPVEKDLTVAVVQALLDAGVASSQVAVLTPYNAQVKLLRASLAALSTAKAGTNTEEAQGPHSAHSSRDVEVETIDRFQGKDADCVIVSAVRSNQAGIVGQLLSDMARVNVAITRAKRKLLIVGSSRTLSQGSVPCRNLLQMMAENGWVKQVPAAGV